MITEMLMMCIVAAPSRLEKDQADFRAIAMWETRGKMNNDAHNKKKGARGIAQIRPIYLKDANEWRKRMGLKPYSITDMHDPHKAFNAFRAYIAKYNFKTTEQRARGHNGGPKGPQRKSTLAYWAGVQTFLGK